MPRFRSLLVVVVLLPVVASAQERVAVLVGVNQYDNRRLTNLQYAERDVADLEPVLKAAGYKVRTLVGPKAKRADVEAALAEALTGRTKKDLVLLAFAGHGVQVEVEGKEQPFFCPVDAVPTESGTLVALNAILKKLDEKGGGQNLMLVDACRNVFDENRGSRGGVNGSRIDGLPEGTAVFFSCSGRQKAYESDQAGGGHGVFFHFVLEGLKGGAVDGDGQVTWERLVPFVRKRVTDSFAMWFADVPAAARQRPHAIGSLTDDPVLVPTVEGTLPGEAAYQRGRKAASGVGKAKNFAAAEREYREAAEAGHPLALALLAGYYRYGNGVAKDMAKSNLYYRQALPGVRQTAERGRADAQYILGIMYSNGGGVDANEAEAVRWIRKAADQNHAEAQNNLGGRYARNIGVVKDEAEAVRWYRKAADQHHAGGQFGLGLMYEQGRGVAKDEAEAVRWYRKAADQGLDLAKSALQRLGKNP